MWSFVLNKGNKQWIWLALDVKTREIVGVYVGARSLEGAQGLWDVLPALYRQCAVSYTDFWSAYDQVFPSKRHRSVGKDSGKTSLIERFNCTLRSSSVTLSQEDVIVFQEVGESYRCNLVLCSLLQCILTSLGLPKKGRKTMSKPRRTSRKVATKASKILRDGRSSKANKSVAGSALSQRKK